MGHVLNQIVEVTEGHFSGIRGSVDQYCAEHDVFTITTKRGETLAVRGTRVKLIAQFMAVSTSLFDIPGCGAPTPQHCVAFVEDYGLVQCRIAGKPIWERMFNNRVEAEMYLGMVTVTGFAPDSESGWRVLDGFDD